MKRPEDMRQSKDGSTKDDILVVVGLGNPGSQYEGSRHNVGFRVLDILSSRHGIRFNEYRFSSLVGYGKIAGKDVVLAKPLTYMNRSGIAVKAITGRYGLDPCRILVVLDDVALDLGRLRLRAKGSSGGHNGWQSIIDAEQTEEVPWLRVGIGMPNPLLDMSCHVLNWFDKEEIPVISEALVRAADAVGVWVEHGIEQAMNEFN